MREHLIDNVWTAGTGPALESIDPATGAVCWSGASAGPAEVDGAFAAARRAFAYWSGMALGDRIALCEAFAERVKAQREELARVISVETGKPMWESRTEVDAIAGKVAVSGQAYRERRAVTEIALGDARGCAYYKPIGVLAVFGPFNLPGHLPNGHVVPALLAGNTVVLKPSERAPSVAEKMVELWLAAGLPRGVMNLVQGARDTGERIVGHPQLDGVLFTGSYAAGRAINRALADEPGRIVALEMGGNNPLVVDRAADVRAAAYHAVVSAFITAGQRCTCARRLIVPEGAAGDAVVDAVVKMTTGLRVGACDDEPAPFMGPVIDEASAQRLLEAQDGFVERGGRVLVQMQRTERGGAWLRPGVIDVTDIGDRSDEEMFGPLLQVIRVKDFDAAIAEANDTRFGLAAGLLSDEAALFDHFFGRIRAGVVNWNRPTTGASGKLPFGGMGESGNHRPSGYFAVDYCADAVASIQKEKLAMPGEVLPGIG